MITWRRFKNFYATKYMYHTCNLENEIDIERFSDASNDFNMK